MRKKLWLVAAIAALLIISTGCSNYYNTPVSSSTPGLWSHYIVYPLSWFLIKVAEIFGGSYGMSIIISTLLIRVALLPLMIKQTKSSKAMQEIQPEVKKLREKYSSKDQQTQKKLQEETMKLFQQNKVNPMAGCFPVLIQMPILIAYYQAIRKTPEIAHQTFLWFNLGQSDYILPIIAAIFTFVQQKLMMGRMGNTNPQMAIMTYVMPIMIAFIGFSLPSALALYWVIGNLFMIGQIFVIYKPSQIKSSQTGGSKK
ncbi:MAG TPA: membrane protein insertase YidC [Bacillales bacterium]|nr:membrane protein insertase YidC [Bacillales bacterium]